MDWEQLLDDLIELHFRRYNLSNTKYAKIIDKKIKFKYKQLRRILIFEDFVDNELIGYMDKVINSEWGINHGRTREMDNRIYVFR